MNFVAIDFETANNYSNSACSVGLVRVENLKITEEYYSLIKPPKMVFNPMNIQIHGIRPKDVEHEPQFDALWESEILPFVKGLPFVAHNAGFDMGVLRALISHYDLHQPSIRYACTVTGSRKTYDCLPNHRLSTVSDHLGIALNHHQALDDARACAKIMIDIFEKSGCLSFEDLCVKRGICLKIF